MSKKDPNVVYLIGNGFDLNLDLKTDYKSFLETYYKKDINDEIVNSTIKILYTRLIGEELNKWVDFEKKLGEITIKFEDHYADFREPTTREPCGNVIKDFNIPHETDVSEFINFLTEVIKNLTEYLKTEQEKFNIDKCNLTKFKSDIEKYSKNNISIIQFNYTNCLDKLIEKSKVSIKKNLHIHGKLEEGILLGVADSEQIANKEFCSKKSPRYEEFENTFVKSKNIAGTDIFNDAMEAINNADIIVAFGISFGDTDKNWCKYIADRLQEKEETELIIFDKYITSKDNFIRNANICDKDELIKRITIHLNTDMFKITP